MDEQTDKRTENLPILQDYVPFLNYITICKTKGENNSQDLREGHGKKHICIIANLCKIYIENAMIGNDLEPNKNLRISSMNKNQRKKKERLTSNSMLIQTEKTLFSLICREAGRHGEKSRLNGEK